MPQTLADFLAQSSDQGTLTSRTPTARERQTDAFRNMLFSDDREGQAKSDRLMNVLDVTGANIPAFAYDLGQEAAKGDVGSLALTAGIGAIPVVGRQLRRNSVRNFLSDASGMFMGERAKTANKSALAVAKDMHEAGAKRESIFAETGWFKGTDGKWRFEVPSNTAEFTAPTKYLTPLKDVYSHPSLYEAYPQIKNMQVRSANDLRGAGVYDPSDKSVQLSARPGAYSRKSVLDHEVQHAIQDIEGWEGGTNPSELQSSVRGSIANQLYLQRKASLEKQLGRKLNPAEDFSVRRESASEGYERSAGEVEAMNTQLRAYGKYDRMPWETQTVPDSHQMFEQPVPGILDTMLGKFKTGTSFGKKSQ